MSRKCLAPKCALGQSSWWCCQTRWFQRIVPDQQTTSAARPPTRRCPSCRTKPCQECFRTRYRLPYASWLRTGSWYSTPFRAAGFLAVVMFEGIGPQRCENPKPPPNMTFSVDTSNVLTIVGGPGGVIPLWCASATNKAEGRLSQRRARLKRVIVSDYRHEPIRDQAAILRKRLPRYCRPLHPKVVQRMRRKWALAAAVFRPINLQPARILSAIITPDGCLGQGTGR